MPVGRPTKYNEKILEKAKDYIDNYQDHDDMIPSIAGLAVVLDVSRETIYDWSRQEEKAAFSDILTKLLAYQEKTLVNNGLSGTFNSTITKLALGKHGYSDKAELSGPEGNPIQVEDVNRPKLTKEEWLASHGVGTTSRTTE